MGKRQIAKESIDAEIIGRCAIFEGSYYFSFGNYIISCEPRDIDNSNDSNNIPSELSICIILENGVTTNRIIHKGRIDFKLSEFNFGIDMDKFGFPVRIKKGLLDRIHDLLCLSSMYGKDNFYTALNREIDSFYGAMITQIYLNRSDRRRWRAPVSAFSYEAAKEFKAVFFDFGEKNEVRRGSGLAGKID